MGRGPESPFVLSKKGDSAAGVASPRQGTQESDKTSYLPSPPLRVDFPGTSRPRGQDTGRNQEFSEYSSSCVCSYTPTLALTHILSA